MSLQPCEPTDSVGSLAGIPALQGAGIGLKAEHLEQAITLPPGPWFEVHTENYLIDGGPRLRAFQALSATHPVSLHGVSASLGGPDRPCPELLRGVRRLADSVHPVRVSEHVAWSRTGGHYFADLLPLPRTARVLEQICDGIDAYQTAIGRQILVENPANYLPFISEMDEPAFLVEIARRSGCGLLLDLNNLFVSARNCGVDCETYLDAIPVDLPGEIHIAGHDADPVFGEALLIDSHAAPVAEGVWQLLQRALSRFGPVPVLLERDDNVPAFESLLQEAARAETLLRQCAADGSCA